MRSPPGWRTAPVAGVEGRRRARVIGFAGDALRPDRYAAPKERGGRGPSPSIAARQAGKRLTTGRIRPIRPLRRSEGHRGGHGGRGQRWERRGPRGRRPAGRTAGRGHNRRRPRDGNPRRNRHDLRRVGRLLPTGLRSPRAPAQVVALPLFEAAGAGTSARPGRCRQDNRCKHPVLHGACFREPCGSGETMVTPRNHTLPAVMCKRNGGEKRVGGALLAGKTVLPGRPGAIGRSYGFRRPLPKPALVWGKSSARLKRSTRSRGLRSSRRSNGPLP